MEDNNNLEKFFRDKFNQKIEPQDWNIPDNDVWENIESNIPPKGKKRRFGILPFILAGALLLLSFFLAYDNYKKGENIVDLEQELKNCGDNIGNIENELKASGTIDLESDNLTKNSVIDEQKSSEKSNLEIGDISVNRNDPKTPITSEKKANSDQNLSEIIKESTSNKSFEKKSTKSDISTQNQTNSEENVAKNSQKGAGEEQNQSNSTSNSIISKDLNSKISNNSSENINYEGLDNLVKTDQPERGQSIENREFISISNLPSLSFNVLKSESLSPEINLSLKTKIIDPFKLPSNSLKIGPAAQYIQWQSKTQGSFDNPLSELLVNEKTSPSIAIGIGLNKKIGQKLVLNTGLLYYQRNQSSQYAINLSYSTIDEISVGSNLENRFEHSLPTSLGSIDTRLVLARIVDSPVSNNENVYLDFSLQNHTKALSLPLTLSYFINRAGNGLFVHAGIMNEFIIENSIEKIYTQSHHTYVKDKSIEVDYQTSQINRFNVSSILGIGYEKTFFQDISVSLSANYGFALTNTFATENYRHKINHFGLQLMVLKSINKN